VSQFTIAVSGQGSSTTAHHFVDKKFHKFLLIQAAC